MTARWWDLFIVLVLIAGTLAVSGCTSGSDTLPQDIEQPPSPEDNGRPSLSQDKYVAIEEHLQVNNKLIEGTYPYPMSITPPLAFYYDGSATSSTGLPGSIDEGYYPEVNDSFKVLYGTTSMRSIAPYAMRAGLQIKGIYSFPYTGESGFTIEGVVQNGTIFGNYDNTSVTLKPGDKWVSPVTSDISKGNGSFANTQYAYTAIFNTTWTITNLGIFDKSNLTRYHNNQSDTGVNMGY